MRPKKDTSFCLHLNPWHWPWPRGWSPWNFRILLERELVGLQVQIDLDHFGIKFQQSCEVQETQGCTDFFTFQLHFLWWLLSKIPKWNQWWVFVFAALPGFPDFLPSGMKAPLLYTHLWRAHSSLEFNSSRLPCVSCSLIVSWFIFVCLFVFSLLLPWKL